MALMSQKDPPCPHVRLDSEDAIGSYYKIGADLGKGAFGIVKEVECRETFHKYAMKVVNKEKAGGSNLKALEREIVILKRVKHEYIIALKQVYETSKRVYMVMELCDQGDLRQLLNKRTYLTEMDTVRIMRNLASAVHYLHRQEIVHRDLKLENILIKSDPIDPDDCSNIRITDFGLSVVKGTGPESYLMSYCGTPLYMAPEILDNKTYTQQCDSWSLGVIAYSLLCGKPPFYGCEESLRQQILCGVVNFSLPVWISISDQAKDCVNGLLTLDPVNRLMTIDLTNHPWIAGPSSAPTTNVLKLMRECRLNPSLLMENGDTTVETSSANQSMTSCSSEQLPTQRCLTTPPQGGKKTKLAATKSFPTLMLLTGQCETKKFSVSARASLQASTLPPKLPSNLHIKNR